VGLERPISEPASFHLNHLYAKRKFQRVQGAAGVLGTFVFLMVLSVFPVQAQVTPDVRDRALQQAAPDRLQDRTRPPQMPKSVIVPIEPDTLKPTYSPEMKKIRFVLNKVVIEGTTAYSKDFFDLLFRNYLKREISLLHVYRFAEAITAKYRNDGYILTKVVVPPQEIAEGVIHLQVIEGYIDQVRFKGEIRGPRKLLGEYRDKLLASRPLRSKDLERYLLLLGDLPGVSVKSVITPSQETPGASDLTLILENKRYSANLGMDNRGTKFNGPLQLSGGFTANSLLGAYERIGAQGLIASNPDELQFLNMYYEMPLNAEGTKIFMSGSFSSSSPGATLKEFEVEGDSTTLSFQVSHPFLRSRAENLTASLGLTARDSQTDILKTADSEDRLRILELGFNYDYADRFRGVNLFSLTLSQGLDIFNATKTGFERLTRERGTSDFTKLSGQYLRLQQLAPTWNLLGAFSWQYAFNDLLASEEFGVGGSQFGRAFDPSEITGDNGVAFKLELQKAFNVNRPYLRDLQAYTFFDHGIVMRRTRKVQNNLNDDLSSLGFGARFNVNNYLSGYLELDLPLGRKVLAEDSRDPRIFFGLTARY